MELLVSCVNADLHDLVNKMKIQSNAIIINQCDVNAYETIEKDKNLIKAYSFNERGVGLSRNNALLRASDEIALFSDDDIEYIDGYENLVVEEFKMHPEADMLLFQFEVCEERRTYNNTEFKRVRWYNCGRYPTFCMAFRTEKVHERNITFSLLFGGGAKYSNGEDSLFIRDCLKKGMKVYATPVLLGREIERCSTWFNGYTDKFFFDRGVLYRHLYGRFAMVFALRFLCKHKKIMCETITYKQALKQMRKGLKQGY